GTDDPDDPDYDDEDDAFPIIVRAIDGDKVTLDGNHPFAGLKVRFQGEVLAIREATPEEIEQGTAETEDYEEDEDE
ncbi:MAG: peptidylprolyl isomerase, partial [Acidobacteria bacterium]|nr:peptidylprolyl isomerase [Acidobacteriota bacterium]